VQVKTSITQQNHIKFSTIQGLQFQRKEKLRRKIVVKTTKSLHATMTCVSKLKAQIGLLLLWAKIYERLTTECVLSPTSGAKFVMGVANVCILRGDLIFSSFSLFALNWLYSRFLSWRNLSWGMRKSKYKK